MFRVSHGQDSSTPHTPPPWSASLYADAKHIARLLLSNWRPGDSISPTLVVHETFLRLNRSGVRSTPGEGVRRGGPLSALIRRAMRSVIVDWIRRRATRRCAGACGIALRSAAALDGAADRSDDGAQAVWCMGESLAKAMHQLSQIDARKAQVAELRCLRGMSTTQIAAALGVSERTVELDWAGAKLWLKRQVAGEQTATL